MIIYKAMFLVGFFFILLESFILWEKGYSKRKRNKQ